MNMPPAWLCVCFCLLASSSARPNWHHGHSQDKQSNSPLPQEQAVDQTNHATFEHLYTIEQDKTQRSTRQAPNQQFFGPGFSLGGHLNFNHEPQFPNQHSFQLSIGHQQFGPPGLHPIKQLGSTIQGIIGSHLEATVQHNNAVHFGTFNNIHPHPPAYQPPCPLCNHHFHGQSSHHLEIGDPHIISSGVHIEQFDTACEGPGCQKVPFTEKPFQMSTENNKEISEAQPSSVRPTTTTEQQDYGNDKDSDIVFESNDKNPKDLEAEYDIDIRFGDGKPGDYLPSKS